MKIKKGGQLIEKRLRWTINKCISTLLIISLVFAILSGCVLGRIGSSSITIFKTNSDKVIVTGTVYDKSKNNKTLPGVAIKSADTLLLTITDHHGKFRVELQAGKNMLRTSYIGYRSASTKSLNLVAGDSVIVDFILKESQEKTIN